MGNADKYTYDVTLSESDRAQAHINLNNLDAPTIWTHAQQHFEIHGEHYSVEDYEFVSAPVCELEGNNPAKTNDETLSKFVAWAKFNCPVAMPGAYTFLKVGLREMDPQHFVKLPDGTWTVEVAKLGWITIDLAAGPWTNKPVNRMKDGKQILDSNYKVLLERDERIVRLQQIIDGFYPSWKKARHIYRNSLRESGELRKRFKHDQAVRDVKWTEQRMKLATAVADLRDELVELTKRLEDDTLKKTHLGDVDEYITEYMKLSRETRKQFHSRLKKKKRK